jgi:hypothetical protein
MRLVVALWTALSAIVLGVGVLVAHLTGSIGWGFVAVVAAFLVEMAILVPIGSAISRWAAVESTEPRVDQGRD